MNDPTRSHTNVKAMDAATLEALRGSIKKWERIVAGTGVCRGVDNCPLCRRFHAAYGNSPCCSGCPVFEATGKRGCTGTPIEDYDDEDGTEEEMLAAAIAEVDFLKSLLPKEAQTDEPVTGEQR